jgi:ABC-2 type transport system ATP-binding protein
VVFSSHQLELVERLCDRVGIVRAGRAVAEGTVEELRDASAPELLVVAPQAPAGWADALPGVAGARPADGGTVVTLADASEGTLTAVLDAARRTGPVHEFRRLRPALSEVYRDTVAEPRGTSTTGAHEPGAAA